MAARCPSYPLWLAMCYPTSSRMQFDIQLTATCSQCGRRRDWPDTDNDVTSAIRGDRVVIVTVDEPCEQCGCDRIKLAARFGATPL